jgi:glutamine amidotransferase
MQLLATTGREHGAHPGLGWIPGEVVPMTPSDPALKIPQMGWNDLLADPAAAGADGRPGHPALARLDPGDHAYFVHSYRFDLTDPRHQLAYVEYGGPVTAIVGRDNLLGVQFHPEKSQAVGLKLLSGFLAWRP